MLSVSRKCIIILDFLKIVSTCSKLIPCDSTWRTAFCFPFSEEKRLMQEENEMSNWVAVVEYPLLFCTFIHEKSEERELTCLYMSA